MKTFDEMRETAKTIAEARFSRDASFHSHSAFYAMASEFAKEFLELEAVVRRVPVVKKPPVDYFKLFFGDIAGVSGTSVGPDREVVGVGKTTRPKSGQDSVTVTTVAKKPRRVIDRHEFRRMTDEECTRLHCVMVGHNRYEIDDERIPPVGVSGTAPARGVEHEEDRVYIADKLAELRAKLDEVERQFVAMKS